jgi:hypothetical protein
MLIVEENALQSQVDKILHSDELRTSEVLRRLLKFLAEKSANIIPTIRGIILPFVSRWGGSVKNWGNITGPKAKLMKLLSICRRDGSS